jgi:O-antigen/teichoic acid export membrane protein
VLTLIKNSSNLLTVAYWTFLTERALQLHDVIELWAITSLICSLLIIALWWLINDAEKDFDSSSLWQKIKLQFKLSYSHFMIGLFAILSLQLDRIMAASLLPLEQVGLYFRHVTLVAFIYQFFNIASFNRLLPSVYANAKKESVAILKGRISREYIKVVVFSFAMYGAFLIAYISPLQVFYSKFELQVELLGILLVTFLIRAAADFNGLVYNAKHKEKSLLKYQIIAMVVGVCAFVAFTTQMGMTGTVIAGMFGASTYLILTERNYKLIESRTLK